MTVALTHTPVDRVSEYKLEEFSVLIIGRFSYINGHALIHWHDALSTIRIGNFSSIAVNTAFFLRTNHHTEWISTYAMELIPWPAESPRPADAHASQKGDIALGNDVWIGEGTRFMPGVTVGDGAVIGAGTVVTRDVPPYAVFAGNPGQVKRMRFPEADISFLLRLKWWDWPTEKVRSFAPLLCSPNFAELRQQTDG